MKAFQQDLRNGMTIEEALSKWGLTFSEAVHKCNRLTNPKKHPEEYKHIHRNHTQYRVERQIRKTRHIVYVNDLNDAVMIRDWLDTNGWNEENIEKVKRKLRK